MKYILEVYQSDTGTEVVLKCLKDDGAILRRNFLCTESEMMHFSVHNGELIFSGHSTKPLFGLSPPLISG